MRASILTGKAKPDKMDDVIQLCKQSILLAMEEQAGFKGAILLCSHDTRQFVVISLWDSLATLLTAEASAYLQTQFREIRLLLEWPLASEHHVVEVRV